MKNRFFLFALAAFALSACTKDVAVPEPGAQKITLRASHEGAVEASGTGTRSAVHDGGTQVYWEPSEQIKVFFNGNGCSFVSLNTEDAAVAEFTGTLNSVVGQNEGVSGSSYIWGLYPFREDAVSDGESVTTSLPAEQTGRAGSFARDTHMVLARSNSFSLSFYNVCGGVRFSLTQEGIKSVSFEGRGGETLAGTVKLGFENGLPSVLHVSEDRTVLTLSAPDGSGFETGKWYYIEAIPGTLSGGYKMVFTKAGESATLVSGGPVTIRRGVFGSLADADAGLTFISDADRERMVDLGLSVKWAEYNVGATRPEEYGDYFAWGETEPKQVYSWSSYKWSNGNSLTLTKYCPSDKAGSWAGPDSPDGKVRLDPEDDAASVRWGSVWRMPTDEEINELIDNCDWQWTSDYSGTGVKGYIVTSNVDGYKDKSIFLPVAGDRLAGNLRFAGISGYYWTSSLCTGYPAGAYDIFLSEGGVSRDVSDRYYGLSVRPVAE